MKNHNRIIFAVLATLLLASCGSENRGAGTSPALVRACEIVPGAEISRIAGAALIESNVDVERTDGTDVFSQCTHTLEGARKRVTVQVRTSAAPMAMSRQLDADKERSNDDGTGYGNQFAEAIEAGSDIEGLGDAAYIFEMHEILFVVAYKDKHVEVRVWAPIGKDGKEWALQTIKAIAAAALQNL